MSFKFFILQQEKGTKYSTVEEYPVGKKMTRTTALLSFLSDGLRFIHAVREVDFFDKDLYREVKDLYMYDLVESYPALAKWVARYLWKYYPEHYREYAWRATSRVRSFLEEVDLEDTHG